MPYEALSKDGFLIVHEFLEPPLVGETIGALEAMEPDERSSRFRRGVTFARRNLLELNLVRELVELPRVRALLSSVVPESIAVRAILFDKHGNANWTVPWHQDRSIAVRERLDLAGFGPWSTKAGIVHVQPPLEVLRQMLTLRFHLDPCGRENGPLRVIAATHNSILTAKDVEETIETRPQTACTTGAGGLLIMRPLVLHASSPAKKPSHRRVIHIEFGPAQLSSGLKWATASE